ncbi:MAG: tRNA epoxyqueuosine(34) reductase QueG [Paludibacteraceae bacterium]
MEILKKDLTDFIKNSAAEVGFDACGIAKAEFLEQDTVFLQGWLDQGFHGEMNYLDRNSEMRTNPTVLVEGCKSVIVTLLNYFPAGRQPENVPKISKYAYSKFDYHTIIKEKLLALENRIKEKLGEDCFNNNRQHRFVDSAPVLERRWAEKAGLGWLGRNKMLINPELGSFCFIGVLMINHEFGYDIPQMNRCGSCRRCLDGCPTSALTENNGLDARKCISYQTIEKKGTIDSEIIPQLSGYVYGCDICNDVCPWNKSRAKANDHSELKMSSKIASWNKTDWENMDKENFDKAFEYSAIQRAGFDKLKNNIAALIKS